MEIGSTPTSRIRLKAAELGFSAVRITRAEPLEKEGIRLSDWLSRGYHASMIWMSRNSDKRTDPSKVLKNAKSVICVAMNYYVPFDRSDDPAKGKISRYAAGNDYHTLISERLEKLLDVLKKENPDVDGKVYVDTGPVMEKAWAVRSGIGWMGKHTNIITKEHGSWVFLGEILIDKELEYDDAAEDRCGKCTACIEACPTKAILEPYKIDSNRCISYLTIEHRGELPTELVPKFRNWLFGCDICQEVCPWNRFAHVTKEQDFMPKKENIDPVLKDLAGITEIEFNERFRNSAVKRIKHSGLIRNLNALLQSAERIT